MLKGAVKVEDNDAFGFEENDGVLVKLSVSEFLEAVNQTLEYAYTSVVIEGEVASFKVNQGKWVFFDLKDEQSSVSCFLTLYQMRMPLEDGMKIIVKGVPKVTKWGKFSLTVRQMQPVGEGSIKKGFELLKKKLAAEGLFDAERKREIPRGLKRIGVISSVQAAGYADFCKILNARWGGMKVLTAHCQVQGIDAPDQIIRALKYFNERAEVEAIAIIRGGGSADDLSVFNDEKLVREIAASRIPVITGIGHEVDESLADLAADVVGSTPSNVAEILTPDKWETIAKIGSNIMTLGRKLRQDADGAADAARREVAGIKQALDSRIRSIENEMAARVGADRIRREIETRIREAEEKVIAEQKILKGVNPELVLKRGYAIVAGSLSEGNVVKITTFAESAEAKIIKVTNKRRI